METITESIAKAVILDSRGYALALTLGVHKADPSRSYLPDLPGGLVDDGETVQDALIREVSEETTIQVDAISTQLLYTDTRNTSDEKKSVTRYLYVIHLDKTPDVALSWEHSAYEWVELAALETIDFKSYNQPLEYILRNKLL